jgi:hypothetical protein
MKMKPLGGMAAFIGAAAILFSSGTLDKGFQPFPDLEELTGFSIPAYCSPGNEERARIVAARCEKAMNYVHGLVGFMPKVSLFVLNPEHWKKYATFPVYGMPHYSGDGRLIIASQGNDLWKSSVPALDRVPKEMAGQFRRVYTAGDGTLSVASFFDLLALHELGHAFHGQAGLTMPRLWLQELFCNLMLHTYIVGNEPDRLPALEVFPETVVAAGTAGFEFTTLADFEKKYSDMGFGNFAWYQCRLHMAARKIYDDGGEKGFIRFWRALAENKEEMTDAQLAHFLKTKVSEEASRVLTGW